MNRICQICGKRAICLDFDKSNNQKKTKLLTVCFDCIRNKEYREKNKEKLLAYHKEYNEKIENKEKRKEYNKKYYNKMKVQR